LSALELIAGHLSVSSDKHVGADQVGLALKAGHLGAIEDNDLRLLTACIFSETRVNLLIRAAGEAGADLHSVDALYRETRSLNMPASPEWETFRQEMLGP
jgi:hypothetical protein